jgi:uncharacterized protein YcbK (DUF882 family)
VRLVVAIAVLVAAASPAAADALSKKEARWQEKQAAGKPLRKLDRKKLLGKPAAKVISIYNTWTHEWVAVEAKLKALPKQLTDRLLRCHFTNEPTDMDNRLSEVVLAAARHFGATRVNIVSGFRAPKYNLMLRKKGRRVAKDSEHTRGHAVDFWMPGVSTEELYRWAMRNQLGGVGKYVSDGFVHMDVGKKRTWVDP